MDAVILYEFPSDNANARSWLLDRVALLAFMGEAELKFVGTERATPDRAGTAMIAVGFAGVGHADAILSEWRREVPFPGSIEMRVLRIESVDFAVAMFP